MRVAITGASGFLGSYVLRHLVACGAETLVLLRDPDAAWRARDVLARVRVCRADLSDDATYAEQLRAFTPTHLVHLAWEGVAGRNRNDTAQWRNVEHTMRLLEHSLAAGARHFVGLGSQAEYGPCAERIDETEATRPTTMYGAAKLATCILAERLCATAGARFAWLRLFSSYGPMDNPDWMIPYLTRALLRREKPAVTRAEQRWDYVYIDDAARAVEAVARHPSAHGIFNLGSGTAPVLRDVIELIRGEVDPSAPIGYGEVPYRPDQVMHLEADIARLTGATGWKPAMPLAEGIRRTVDWYRTNEAA
jgi:nucleoside-diphosphate-sugar epimerase